jgi:hypothetical protein
MSSKFASGKHSIAECDRCGERYKLTLLRKLTIKTKQVNILVCNECFELDHPQLSLGLYPVTDAMGVRNPRPDVSYQASGVGVDGYSMGGSRQIEWGWAPVGGASSFDTVLTPNNLIAIGIVGTVTIS